MDLSYCVVNTNGRDYLRACLAAIDRTHPPELSLEVLVLDNCSEDGSADMVRAEFPAAQLVALDRRTGKAENDSTLLRAARGRYALLLNEDAELRPGSTRALLDALEADPHAGAAGAQLLTSEGLPTACAWRLPGFGPALAGALFLHRRYTVQSRGAVVRPVGWVQSSAMLVRTEAARAVDYLDPDFFVYSDETDFCKRLRDAGWEILFVPAAEAVHHDQLTTDLARARPRIVEFHRNRDRYMAKHHGPLQRIAVRLLGAWFYAVLAAVALLAPGHDPRRYALHLRQELRPDRGAGLREGAEEFNRALDRADAAR